MNDALYTTSSLVAELRFAEMLMIMASGDKHTIQTNLEERIAVVSRLLVISSLLDSITKGDVGDSLLRTG